MESGQSSRSDKIAMAEILRMDYWNRVWLECSRCSPEQSALENSILDLDAEQHDNDSVLRGSLERQVGSADNRREPFNMHVYFLSGDLYNRVA